jgi:hypothetical protein
MAPPKRHGMSDIMACWNPDQKVVPGWSASRLESEPLAPKNQAPWQFMVPDLPDPRIWPMSEWAIRFQNRVSVRIRCSVDFLGRPFSL